MKRTGTEYMDFYDIYADDEQKYVKNNLREMRIKAGQTQQELADKTGMKQTFIQKLEKQQANFTAATLIKCARILNCSLSDLLDVDLPEKDFPDRYLKENNKLRKKLEEINKLSEI